MDHTAIGVFDNVDTSKKANEKPVQIHFIDACSCTEVYPNETLPTEELGIVPVDPFQRGKDEVQILEDGIKQVHFVDASSSTEVYPNEILFTEEVEIVTVDPFPKENNEITILEDDIKQIHFIDASSSTEDCSSEALHNEEPENVPVDPFQKEEKEIKVLEVDIKETVIVEDLTGCKLEKIQNDTLLQPEDGISDPLKCNLKLEENKSLKLEDKKPIEKDCDSKLKDQGTQTDIFVDQACQTDPEGSFLNPFTEEDSVLAEGSVITREQENVSGHSLGNNKGSKTFQTSAGSLTLSIAPAYNTSTPKNLPKTCQKRPSMIKESPELKKGHVSGLTLVSDKSKNTLQIMNTSGGLALKTAACKSLPKTFNKSVMEVKASSDLEKVTELNEEMEDPLLDDDEQHFMDFDIDIKEEIDCLEIETLPKEDGKPKCLPLHKNQSEASEKITSEHVPSSDPKIKQYGRGRQDNNCISQTSSLKKIAVNQKYSKKENLYGFTIVKNMNYNKTLEIEGDSLFSSNVLVLDTATPTSLPETCKESVMKVKASPALEKYGGKCHKNKSVSQPSLSKKNAVHLKPKPKKKKKVGEISLNLNRRNMTLQIVEDSPFSKGLLDPDTVFHKPATKTYKKKCKAKSSSESEKEPGQSCNIPPVANINIPSTASVTSFTLKNPLDVFESDSGPVFSPLDNDFNHLSTLSDYSATIHQEPKARSISFAVAGTSSTGDSIASSITTVAGKSAGKDAAKTSNTTIKIKSTLSEDTASIVNPSKGPNRKTVSVINIKPADSWPQKCFMCEKCFNTNDDLTNHCLESHSVRESCDIKCKTCRKSFSKKELFIKHLDSHKNKQQRCYDKKKLYVCEVCDKSFYVQINLLVHRGVHSAKRPHVCKICGKHFTQQNTLANHKCFLCRVCLKFYDGQTSFDEHQCVTIRKKSFTCNTCGKSFFSKGHLENHQNTHLADLAYVCDICGKRFHVQSKLMKHKKTHSKIKYGCTMCKRTYVSKKALEHHVEFHKINKRMPCKICGKCFDTNYKLSNHELIHSEEKPFSCELCGKCFKSKPNLTSHNKTHRPKIKMYLCKFCGASFNFKSSLLGHENNHLGERERMYECEICKKSFNHYNLRRHKKVHSKERPRPFVCKICGKSFHWGNNLRVHERIHTGNKPFVCKVCGKTCSQYINLLSHQRIHTGEKPYKCEVCGLTFAHRGSLVSHEDSHEGLRPFKCKTCGKSFRDQNDLEYHKNRVHKVINAYVCDVCGVSFSQKENLVKHIEEH